MDTVDVFRPRFSSSLSVAVRSDSELIAFVQCCSLFYTRLLCVSIKLLLKRNTLLAYFILQIYNAITKHGEGEIRDIKKTILMYET